MRTRRERFIPDQSKDPNSTIPTHKKKEETGKTIMKTKKESEQLGPIQKNIRVGLTPSNTVSARSYYRDNEEGIILQR